MRILHLCTFKTPTSGLFISAKATLPCAFEMRKGVSACCSKYRLHLFEFVQSIQNRAFHEHV